MLLKFFFIHVILFGIAYAINPVVLVPGLGGSRAYVKVNESHNDYFYCTKHIPHFELLWVNIEYMLPFTINCFTERMTLEYNNVTHRTSNREGVVLSFPGWGNTTELEYLSPLHIGEVEYFYRIVDELVTNHGYKRGVSVRAAPFDFRKGPNELVNFELRLKKLVEDTYKLNGNKTVILIAHSYGCPLTLQMLNNAGQSWKDKYIRSFVSLEGPYYGSPVTVKMLILGYTLNVPTLEGSWLRTVQRTWPSSYALMPDERMWGADEILVKTPYRNYTSRDYVQFFKDLKYETGADHYNDTKQLINPEIPPGVETFCVVGQGLPTDAMVDCTKAKSWPDDVSGCVVVSGDGDGTVPWRSLNMCTHWNNSMPHPFHYKVFPKADHFKVLSDDRLIQYISSEVIDKE